MLYSWARPIVKCFFILLLLRFIPHCTYFRNKILKIMPRYHVNAYYPYGTANRGRSPSPKRPNLVKSIFFFFVIKCYNFGFLSCTGMQLLGDFNMQKGSKNRLVWSIPTVGNADGKSVYGSIFNNMFYIFDLLVRTTEKLFHFCRKVLKSTIFFIVNIKTTKNVPLFRKRSQKWLNSSHFRQRSSVGQNVSVHEISSKYLKNFNPVEHKSTWKDMRRADVQTF